MVYRWKKKLLNLTIFSVLESNLFNRLIVVNLNNNIP